jgi:hypothetical protein
MAFELFRRLPLLHVKESLAVAYFREQSAREAARFDPNRPQQRLEAQAFFQFIDEPSALGGVG